MKNDCRNVSPYTTTRSLYVKNSTAEKQLSHLVFDFLCRVTVVWLLASTSIAHSGENTLPPYAQSLIGLKIPPIQVERKNLYTRQPTVKLTSGATPNFVDAGNGTLIFESEKPKYSLAFEQGFVNGEFPSFLVVRLYPDHTKEILDVIALPKEQIEWALVNGKIHYLSGRYRLSERCHTQRDDSRTILGLVKPEKGKENCAHDSSQVKKAWMIDTNTGKTKPFPTRNLKCYFITMNEC